MLLAVDVALQLMVSKRRPFAKRGCGTQKCGKRFQSETWNAGAVDFDGEDESN